MLDLAELRAECHRLQARLQGRPNGDRLKAVYMDMAPLIGQLHGAVNQTARSSGEIEAVAAARVSLEDLKVTARQVGFDIRLSSDAALASGLPTALEQAGGGIGRF